MKKQISNLSQIAIRIALTLFCCLYTITFKNRTGVSLHNLIKFIIVVI